MTKFKEGDVVYIVEEHRFTWTTDLDGKLTVLESNDRWTMVDGPNMNKPQEIFTYRLALWGRAEGEEIEPEDVQVGDLIRYEEECVDGTTGSREGLVNSIKADGKFFYSPSGIPLNPIFFLFTNSKKLTLVKAAENRDELLERVEAAEAGQIVEIPWQVGQGQTIARKDGIACWAVYTGGGREYDSDGEFADRIRGVEKVEWLSR